MVLLHGEDTLESLLEAGARLNAPARSLTIGRPTLEIPGVLGVFAVGFKG